MKDIFSPKSNLKKVIVQTFLYSVAVTPAKSGFSGAPSTNRIEQDRTLMVNRFIAVYEECLVGQAGGTTLICPIALS